MILQRLGNRGIRLGTLFERAAARHPATVVFLDHDLDIAPELGRRPTVGELANSIAITAGRIRAAGVHQGDHVVVYKTNGFDIPLLACAIVRIGAVPVLLSPTLDGATVAALIRRVGTPHLITDPTKLVDQLSETIGDLTAQILSTTGHHPRAVPLASFHDAVPAAAVRVSPDLPTLVTHTSGTTGIPKLAVHTCSTLEARYRPQAAATALVRDRRPVAMYVSFVHSRLFTAVALTLLRGFPLIVLADDTPARVAEMFVRLRPGIVEAHPNTFMAWEELAQDPRRPLAGVRFFSSTFDALHPRTVRTLLGASDRRLPVFAQLYGQSEVGPIVGRIFTRTCIGEGRCVGRPFPGMTGVRVVSGGGARPSAENPGYIEVRTDGRVRTYLGEDARYAEQVRDGWWRMGDVGYRTRWGCLHLLDREVDLIEGFGSTLAAEDLLFGRIPELAEVIIVPGVGAAPTPVVCTRDDVPLDAAVWRAAAAELPAMADPVQWRLGELPQTATAKIKRLELARLLREGMPG